MSAPDSGSSATGLERASSVALRTEALYAEQTTHGNRQEVEDERAPPRCCPHDCPCDTPKSVSRANTSQLRSIGEVKEGEEFTRKIEDVREANFRLANRLTRLSGSLRFDGSSWSVGSSGQIWATIFRSPHFAERASDGKPRFALDLGEGTSHQASSISDRRRTPTVARSAKVGGWHANRPVAKSARSMSLRKGSRISGRLMALDRHDRILWGSVVYNEAYVCFGSSARRSS